MGNSCNKQPLDRELLFTHTINHKRIRLKKQKQIISNYNQPDSSFAICINQIPQLIPIVRKRNQQLGSFHYQQDISYGKILQPYKLNNNSIYHGQWNNGRMNGKGKLYFPDGAFLQGQFNQNQCSGFARLIHNNGDYFQGVLIGNKANGNGIYVENKTKYVGQFKNNKPHGRGRQCSQFTQFQGWFENGFKKKGKMIVQGQNQSYQYQGEYYNNKFQGYGKLKDKFGIYEGQFKNGQKNGNGKFTWLDGKYYFGQYKNNVKNGHGIFSDKDGKKLIQSQWINGNLK